MVLSIGGLTTSASSDQVDLIVYGDHLVISATDPVIENGAVAIHDGVIVAAGTAADIDQTYSADKTVSGDGKILMPGLVNGHTHSAMTLFRGLADDLDLMTWLNSYIFPAEGQFVDPEFITIGAELACLEMVEGGTTSFVDMYFYPETLYSVVEKCGLRALLGAPMIDFPSPGFKGWDDSFKAGVDFVKSHQGKNDRIIAGFAPHAPYTVAPEHLKAVADIARELQAPVTTHIAEDRAEVETIRERYGATTIEHYAAQGYFDSFHTIGAHVVWPADSDLDIVKNKPFGAIHNPSSNMKLGAGFSPIEKMINEGIPVGLGTDGAASNNNLSLWDEMHLAGLIHKGNSGSPTAMPAATVVDMATRMGAKAAGLSGIGTLEKGMRADMIQISLDRASLTPIYDVISHLVYAVSAADVETTIVDGKILMQDRNVLTLDRNQVIARAREKAEQIKASLGSKK